MQFDQNNSSEISRVISSSMEVFYTLTYKIRRDISMWYTHVVLKIGSRNASESSWNCFFSTIPQTSRGQRRYLQHTWDCTPSLLTCTTQKGGGSKLYRNYTAADPRGTFKKTKKKTFWIMRFLLFFFTDRHPVRRRQTDTRGGAARALAFCPELNGPRTVAAALLLDIYLVGVDFLN